jgi:hypothetical protein
MPPVRPKSPPRAEPESETRRPPERGLPPLRVRYYGRMKKQRVYNVLVTWDSEFAYRGPEQSVVVRLIAGGAQVVPAEVRLDPNNSRDQAFFHVTPLAKGWLRGQKMEVVVNGKKVQEIQLQSRVVSQRWTWLFFFLVFLAPWFVLEYVKTDTALSENEAQKLAVDSIAANVPDTPGFLADGAVHTGLLDFREFLGRLYGKIHRLAWEQPLTFYVGLGFFVLMLLSAFVHRDKRRTRVGKPLFLPQPPREEEQEEEG